MPPESEFGQLDHRVPVARAEVRSTTNLDDVARAIREDPSSYGPLTNPDAPSEHGFSPPSPVVAPATEGDLRDALRDAITSKDFAQENLQRAVETSARAITHREQCEIRLRDFADLDERITDATIEGLRSGRGRPMHDDDPLRHEVVERGIARDDLSAATRAEAVLDDALRAAKDEADTATKAATHAAATLSLLLAERMAERVFAHEAEAQRLREALFGADTVGVPTPAILRPIYGDGQRFLRPVDRSAWVALRERLLADPTAKLELEGVE